MIDVTCNRFFRFFFDFSLLQSTVWLCRTCLDRRQNLNWPQQQQQSGLTSNQQTVYI